MICRLTIVAGFKKERSYLKDTFFTRPFRVINVGQYHLDTDLYLMIMSSSPGLLDGDHWDISVKVESSARLQLQSQAYQRLFKMQEGASQQTVITLEPGCAFSYIPHPIVPHQNSRFKGHTIVHMGDGATLMLSEIITCGRKHSGEVFKFNSFQNVTEVYHNEKLIVKENVWLSCLEHLTPDVIGQFEGYTHQGALMYILTKDEAAGAHMDEIFRFLETEGGINFGLSSMEANGFLLRILANGGEQIFNCFKRIEERLWPSDSVGVKEEGTFHP